MGAHAQVEAFLAGQLDEVLVGADARRLQRLRAQLLILVGHQVHAQRKVVDRRALAAKIEDADLGVGHTAVEARLRVRLRAQNVSTNVGRRQRARGPPRSSQNQSTAAGEPGWSLRSSLAFLPRPGDLIPRFGFQRTLFLQ